MASAPNSFATDGTTLMKSSEALTRALVLLHDVAGLLPQSHHRVADVEAFIADAYPIATAFANFSGTAGPDAVILEPADVPRTKQLAGVTQRNWEEFNVSRRSLSDSNAFFRGRIESLIADNRQLENQLAAVRAVIAPAPPAEPRSIVPLAPTAPFPPSRRVGTPE